jgi:5-methylcytosine-specific restriction endonuclease McrA
LSGAVEIAHPALRSSDGSLSAACDGDEFVLHLPNAIDPVARQQEIDLAWSVIRTGQRTARTSVPHGDNHETRAELRARLSEAQNWRCCHCGVVMGEGGVPATFDHVIPRAHGGSGHWRNLVMACGPCNERRGTGRGRRCINIEIELGR